MKVEDWIDPHEPATRPPPSSLLAFLRWAMSGSFRVMSLGAFVSILAGVLEVLSALILGVVIDAALASNDGDFFASNGALIAGVLVFFLVLRPAVLGISGVTQSVIIAPAVYNLVLSRLHRHSLGQSVRFFDDDFAGRISQKQMQAARATTDLAVEMIHTVFFALSSLI